MCVYACVRACVRVCVSARNVRVNMWFTCVRVNRLLKPFRRLQVPTQHAMADQFTHTIVVVMVIRVQTSKVRLFFLQVDSDASLGTIRERDKDLLGQKEGRRELANDDMGEGRGQNLIRYGSGPQT